MQKVCVILYHKNILKILKKSWVDKCINSLKNQSYKDFDVLELDYGNTCTQFYENSIFESISLNNHVEAMNYLIQKAKDLQYDYIFNCNIDDYYHNDRIKIQLKYLETYDMVSSDYIVFKEHNEQQIVMYNNKFSNLDIIEKLNSNVNIIGHPCVAWNASFFDKLTYIDDIPHEDIELWKRALSAGKKIYIIPQILLYYRFHPKQITQLHKNS